jgi:hypothetical protein
MHGVQEAITKGKVDEAVTILYGIIWRVGREMDIKTTKFR